MSKSKGPTIRRHESEQSVGTPRVFLDAVEWRFGAITFDLAADRTNAVVPRFFSKEDDALAQPWPSDGLLWLNPPFSNIGPWAKKCAETVAKHRRARILFLVPASIGANWFAEHVHRKAFVFAVQGRLTFTSHSQAYPKDLILAAYDGSGLTGFDVWDWRREAAALPEAAE